MLRSIELDLEIYLSVKQVKQVLLLDALNVELSVLLTIIIHQAMKVN